MLKNQKFDLAVGETMKVYEKCVVVLNNLNNARFYNLEGKFLGSASSVKYGSNWKGNVIIGQNVIVLRNGNLFTALEYTGRKIGTYYADIIEILKHLGELKKRVWYKGFRRRVLTIADNFIAKEGEKIWISQHYLIVKTEDDEMRIYRKDEKIKLLGTIPSEIVKKSASFEEVISQNCCWYGLYEDMAIREQKGWKTIDYHGIVMYEGIADEVFKLLIGADEKISNNEKVAVPRFDMYGKFNLKEGATFLRYDRFVAIRENEHSRYYSFYSLEGTFIGKSVIYNEMPRFIQTEKWIALETTGERKRRFTLWQICDYNGNKLYDYLFDSIQRKGDIYIASVTTVSPNYNTYIIFRESGEVATKFDGKVVFIEFLNSQYIKVVRKKNEFDIYDYNGVKVFDKTFCDEDIFYEGIILVKDDKGYTEYDVETRKKYRLNCQKIDIRDDLGLVIIKAGGVSGVFRYTSERNVKSQFVGFEEVVPIEYDKITGDSTFIYARYKDQNLYGEQCAFENIYDKEGNVIAQVRV